MPSLLETKIYRYIWPKDSMRTALIKFKTEDGGKFIFDKCEFVGIVRQGHYTIDEWEFLRDLANEILELEKKEEEIKCLNIS